LSRTNTLAYFTKRVDEEEEKFYNIGPRAQNVDVPFMEEWIIR
jgi:hypothetical protein